MKIASATSSLMFDSPNTKEDQSIDDSYRDIINSLIGDVASEDEQKKQAQDAEVKSFLDDLSSKGAAKFLYELNQDKIDKKVQEYKAKLMNEMGDSPEALAKIDTMINEFKKELLENSTNSLDSSKNNQSKNDLTSLLLKI